MIQFFTSIYCAPCKPIERMLARINLSLFGNQLKIQKIDISEEKNMELAKNNNILSVPAIVIGSRRTRYCGCNSKRIDFISKSRMK
ncbi:MAG: thioredoxin family protein [Promethearchaeota archaeon]